ncbi:MAG: hypothetical protein RLW68_16940 [Devosia marina]|uniref:hypothetical protein n=1 Tax=Devosia marina TaxID=2683198 RepID=UPI0032EF6073
MSSVVLAATALTAAILATGYFALGFWAMLKFTSGFVTGLVLFLLRPGIVPFSSIRGPFFVAFGLVVVHRVEECIFEFFDNLAAITGVAAPVARSIREGSRDVLCGGRAPKAHQGVHKCILSDTLITSPSAVIQIEALSTCCWGRHLPPMSSLPAVCLLMWW